MHDYLQTRFSIYPVPEAALTTNLVDFGSTGVKAVFTFPLPIEVLRAGIIVDTNDSALLDVGAGFTITVDKYVTPGTATGSVELGTLTSTVDRAVGVILYNSFSAGDADGEVAEDNSTRYESPRNNFDDGNKFIVNAGQQVVFEVTDAADTTGNGFVWIEYVQRPFAGSQISTAVEVTS